MIVVAGGGRMVPLVEEQTSTKTDLVFAQVLPAGQQQV